MSMLARFLKKRGNIRYIARLLCDLFSPDTVQELTAMIDVALAGRLAEEIIFGAEDVSTGATSDFETVGGEIYSNAQRLWVFPLHFLPFLKSLTIISRPVRLFQSPTIDHPI